MAQAAAHHEDLEHHEHSKHHGHSKKNVTSVIGGALTKTFGVAVKATALYAGFIFIDGFFDFGLIHSEGWAESGLGSLSKEFLSPVTSQLPEFFSEGFGAEMLTMLRTALKSIHRAFGVDDTFIDKPSVTQNSDTGAYGGSVSEYSDTVDEVFENEGGGTDLVLDALENL